MNARKKFDCITNGSLCRTLRLLRKAGDLTQKELAAVLQISVNTIYSMENSCSKPSMAVLTKYAEAFDLPLSSIFYVAEHLNDTTGSWADRVLVPHRAQELLITYRMSMMKE